MIKRKPALGVVSDTGEIVYRSNGLLRYRKLFLVCLSLAVDFFLYLATIIFAALGIGFVIEAHWQAATTAWMVTSFLLFVLLAEAKWRK